MSNTIKFVKKDPRAVTPTKAHDSDSGWDLTVIDTFKQVHDNITMFETGIAVAPPPGYYTEIVPRSSISKTGYMLANSVGIIDHGYRNTLKIAVIKIVDDLPDLIPPFCRFQLVLRKLESATMVEVDSLDDTERGEGGFGSTDKK